MLAGAGVVSFVVAFVAARLLAGRFAAFALDQPNARSLHERPVPRTGGIAVLAGALGALYFVAAPGRPALLLALFLALALGAISLADDLRGVPIAWRLLAHAGASALVVWQAGAPLHPGEALLLVLALAWITNLYNFMDGSDGLAGGMAVIGFGTYALAAWSGADLPLAALSLALAAGAGAFLTCNFPPARLFLGDVGSIPLGFLAGALGLLGWSGGLWPLWFPLLAFGPFIGDATLTLARRLLRRERVWQAHRDHYYQRLVRMGFGHRDTALIGYATMAACGALALFGRTQAPPGQLACFLGASCGLALLAAWIDLRWAKRAA